MPLTFEMVSYIAIYKQKRHAGRVWRPVPAHDDQDSETRVLPGFPLGYEGEHRGLLGLCLQRCSERGRERGLRGEHCQQT